MLKTNNLRNRVGFTLIELLVVIGVLAVIAAGVVALINPVDKIAQANDAKVANDVAQLATAVQSYAAQQSTGYYPCATAAAGCPNGAGGQNGLAAVGPSGTGELTTIPTLPTGGSYGYLAANPGSAAMIYGALSSNKYKVAQCAGVNAYWVWNSTNGKSCSLCSAATPTAATACP